ncbi:hypothetical protein, partial [Roseiflexus sp.]|uniref:hypothetical protein n=1 Tax=Roseiflexus sp. TaxID=2562120 RepID=UPI00398BB670
VPSGMQHSADYNHTRHVAVCAQGAPPARIALRSGRQGSVIVAVAVTREERHHTATSLRYAHIFGDVLMRPRSDGCAFAIHDGILTIRF